MSPASDSHIITGSHTLKCTPPRALSTTGCPVNSTYTGVKNHSDDLIPTTYNCRRSMLDTSKI
ncbi:MAG: hypothetical protein WCF03_16765 [Nitrososphaeraceae archaeon]